jgi:hypothetical protein
MPILGKRSLLLEHAQYGAEKQHVEEDIKSSCRRGRKRGMQKEEKQRGVHAKKPSHVRVRVLDMNLMDIIH